MQRVYQFPISLSEYCRQGKRNLFPELWGCTHKGCRYPGRLRRHGFYTRSAITLEGVMTAWVQRYLCPVCGHTTSLLPSSLLPRYQYAISVIAWVLRGLHELQLSISQLVSVWPVEEAGFSRQQVQFLNRRLAERKPSYQLFLKVGGATSMEIGALLLQHSHRLGGLEQLALSFYESWGPLLAKVKG